MLIHISDEPIYFLLYRKNIELSPHWDNSDYFWHIIMVLHTPCWSVLPGVIESQKILKYILMNNIPFTIKFNFNYIRDYNDYSVDIYINIIEKTDQLKIKLKFPKANINDENNIISKDMHVNYY